VGGNISPVISTVLTLGKRHCCIDGRQARAGWAGASSPCPAASAEVRFHRVPLPARCDHRGSALIPALRPESYRERGGAAGRTQCRGGSRHDLPVGAAVHAAVDRRGTAVPAHRRGSVVRRRNLRQGRRTVGVSISGDRPVQPGHRRAGVPEAGSGGHKTFSRLPSVFAMAWMSSRLIRWFAPCRLAR
jgi:hypothetical protein